MLYHRFALPKVQADKLHKSVNPNKKLGDFGGTFKTFFQKDKIVLLLAFLLFYRLGEAMLARLASPFLLDPVELGGLGLSTEQVGLAYGTVGVIALVLGGILGGFAVSMNGLKFWLIPMALFVALPNLAYAYMAFLQPADYITVISCVAIGQFGYGFGFAAFLMYMIYMSEGEFKTAHYALATGFMALSMMLSGMAAGWLQEQVGYKMFFVIVSLMAIPTIWIAASIKLDSSFGKKK